MSNTKISGLSSASTPLSGSEIVPLNQSGVTDSVSVANLTAGRAVSVSTLTATSGTIDSGVNSSSAGLIRIWSASNDKRLQLSNNGTNSYINSTYGSSGGSSLILQVSDTDTLKLNTSSYDITAVSGNFVQGTASKGINFTANTPASGMTSQLLNWYETGTWTATATGMTTSPTGSVNYTRIGNQVTLNFPSISGTSNSNSFTLTGLPTNLQPVSNNFVLVRITDNGVTSVGMAYFNASGTVYLYHNLTGAGSSWTNSGTKTIEANSISYLLS